MASAWPQRAAGITLLLLAAGCMLRQVPDGADGAYAGAFDDWETARSAHFVLHTDAGLGAIETIIARFEDTYEALKATFFRGVEVPAVEALVFADAAEYREVAGANSAGRFLPGVGGTGSLLVVRHSENPEVLEVVVAHELAHRFADAAHPALPNWLDEGIASYLESVDVRGDEVRFGAASMRSGHGFSVGGGVTFNDLVRVTPDRMYGSDAQSYYAAAWALVHYLMNGRGGALRARVGQLLVEVEAATRRNQTAEAAFAEVYPDLTGAELDQAIARLVRSLGRPAVHVVLSMSFRRPPPGRIERGPARADQVSALVRAVHRRRRPTVEPVLDLTARPHVARFDAQLGFDDVRYFGVAYGQMFRGPFGWEVGLGLGPLGYQAEALARGHLNVGEGGNFFLTAGLGPVLGLKSTWLGNRIVRHEDAGETGEDRRLYTFFGLHPEVAAEVRTPSNVVVRVSAGALFRLTQNLTRLCAPPIPPRTEPRCSDSDPGQRIARSGRDVFARFGLGYSW
jgi:hypothetical protein